jgi:oligoribonuclease NrnB/cAMP/cGMP phosphodiesterase (DHH superfamily)
VEDVIIHHNDLDGIGCLFVAREMFPDIVSVKAGYHNINDKLAEVLDDEPELLIIADIWSDDMPDHTIEALKNFRGQLLIFDHHQSSAASQDSLRRYGAEVCNQMGTCATKQMAQFFNVSYPVIDIINDYDTSGVLEGQAGDLNTLFWENKNWYMLKRVFPRKPFFFDDGDREKIDNVNDRKNKYFQNILKKATDYDINGHSVVYVEGSEHLGYVLQRLLEKYEYAIMNNKSKGKVSVRGLGDYASAIAEYCGGGGHPRAAGISRKCTKTELMKAAREVLSEAN